MPIQLIACNIYVKLINRPNAQHA